MTWPASVKWPGSVAPPIPAGRSWIGFITDDGGTTWVGILGPAAVG
jgi:hypothetical protein